MTWQATFPSDVIGNCSTSFNASGTNRFRAHTQRGWLGDFSKCILNNRPSKVADEEGLHDVRIMKVIYVAARTGRASVRSVRQRDAFRIVRMDPAEQ
jgi:hypothetical protein